MAKGGRGASKKKSITASAKAGLQYPVTRTQKEMKKKSGMRVGPKAAAYLTAVEEYLNAEVLELAGNAARDNRKQQISPRHLKLAIGNDEELNKLMSKSKGAIAGGGVLPGIHNALLPKRNDKGKLK